MAYLSLTEQPADFAPAYKPIIWGFTSTRSPVNNMAGETVGIVSIGQATAADVGTYGAPLTVGDVFVIHGAIAFDIFVPGQQVLIAGTADGLYDGLYRIKYDVTSTVTVLDTEYVGDDSNGSIAKNYENYRLIGYVSTQNHAEDVRFAISPAGDDVFRWNVADLCATTFKDVFDIAEPSLATEGIDAAGYITQTYQGIVYEAYMVPDTNGINVYTEFDKGENIQIRGVAVNSVQPYHHIEEDSGSVDLVWEDDLAEYKVAADSDNETRWLTYAPRGFVDGTKRPEKAIPIGPDDDYFLAHLFNGTDTAMKLRVQSFDQDGTSLLISTIDYTAYTGSTLIPCGPLNLGANIDPAAHHYTVHIKDASLIDRSERMVFRIDEQCNSGQRRLFALNEFGAIDAYTLTGREARETTVKRDVAYRIDLPVDLLTSTRRGATQRRTYATDIRRTYTNTTRTENKKTLRWLVDCFFESPDVRALIYENTSGEQVWTQVIIDTQTLKMGGVGGRMLLAYSFGIDEQKQRR